MKMLWFTFWINVLAVVMNLAVGIMNIENGRLFATNMFFVILNGAVTWSLHREISRAESK